MDKQRRLREYKERAHTELNNKINRYCIVECVDLNIDILSKDEKNCLVNCNGKLMRGILPIYKKYFDEKKI